MELSFPATPFCRLLMSNPLQADSSQNRRTWGLSRFFRRKNGTAPLARFRTLRRGQWVVVRPLDEILATLQTDGKLDGMPFMPEMIEYCGRKFRVARRADRIFIDRFYYIAKLKNTVFLETPRCNGRAHGGCQMRCELFWKEAWLKPVDPENDPETGPRAKEPAPETVSLNLPTRKGDLYVCQATELISASSKLPWFDPRQYVQEVILGETTVGRLFVNLMRLAGQKIVRYFKAIVGAGKKSPESFLSQPTPTDALNLKVGDWVEVKSIEEIRATLDSDNRNRGLAFAREQAVFCGKRLRVAGRVEKIVIESSGEMRTIANTVELEQATCLGRMCRSCPRNCYHLWREIWLRRAPESK
jgi:hypothetical protein